MEVKVIAERRETLQLQGAAYEERLAYAGSKHEKIAAADTTSLGASSSSSRRGVSGKGAAELNERGSSSWLINQSPCVGTFPCTGSTDPSSGHNAGHYWDAHHRMKPGGGLQEATSCLAPAVTWHEGDVVTCTHTCHHHYYGWQSGAQLRPIGSSHACRGAVCCCCCCCVMKPPPQDDLDSHGGPPKRGHKCPVNKEPCNSQKSKRFSTEEEDLYAAPSLTVFKAKPLKPCSRQLPPFPSAHGFPFVLCQHCSHLLLLPPGTLLLSPSGTLLPHPLLSVKLKCGSCLNISKFSTRHLHRAPSFSPPTAGIAPPSPLPSPSQFPVGVTSMPGCNPSHGIMQEAPQLLHVKTAAPPLIGNSEDSNNVILNVLINGNAEHSQEYENLEPGAPLNGVCELKSNQERIEAEEPPQPNGACGDLSRPKHVETGVPYNGICEHTSPGKDVGTGEFPNGVLERSSEQNNIKTGARINGDCGHEPSNGVCGNSSLPKHVGTGALFNGICEYTSLGEDVGTGEFSNGGFERSSQQNNIKTGAHMNGDCGHASRDKEVETGELLNGLQYSIMTGAHGNGPSLLTGVPRHDSQSDREQEITAFSSVQDWVDSLTLESGYESDPELQGALNCQNSYGDGCEKLASSHHRPPLHQHFGYDSPSELFEKVFFSEDEEMKTRTETNSTASSSSSFINACQQPKIKAASMHVHAPSLRAWNGVSSTPDNSSFAIRVVSPKGEDQDAQRFLTGFLKRGLLPKGCLLPASSKTRVVVNGHVLSRAAVQQAEERAGKLRSGAYWYDCKAGFWGVERGPCLGILPPFIEELNYPMLKNCSNGDTQVYINGRELHVKDLFVLSQRGLSQKAGRAYALDFDGVLVDETTGLELKRLGKLAPTVERRGKGFGMFTADVLK